MSNNEIEEWLKKQQLLNEAWEKIRNGDRLSSRTFFDSITAINSSGLDSLRQVETKDDSEV